MKMQKTLLALSVAGALSLGLVSAPASATCMPNIPCLNQAIGVNIGAEGWYNAGGLVNNSTTAPGTITARETLNESGGSIDLYARSALDECADCEGNSLGAKVEGTAFNRGYTGIQTTGPDSTSYAHGAAELGATAIAQRVTGSF